VVAVLQIRSAIRRQSGLLLKVLVAVTVEMRLVPNRVEMVVLVGEAVRQPPHEEMVVLEQAVKAMQVAVEQDKTGLVVAAVLAVLAQLEAVVTAVQMDLVWLAPSREVL